MDPSPTHRDRKQGATPALPQAAPHMRAMLRADVLMWTLLAAAVGLSLVGWVFYGPRVVVMAAIAVAAAAVTEWLCSWLTHRPSTSSLIHSLAMGLLAVLMLPVTGAWYGAAAGAAIAACVAVGVGKWLMGGLGHYPWHPAVVGVLVLYMIWPAAVTPERWPLLSRGHIVAGDGLRLAPLEDVPVLVDWGSAAPAREAIGFAMPRPETVLERAATQPPGESPRDVGPVAEAVRDRLPSAWDMLIGATAAPVGQGSTLALIAAGLLLISRGYLRWALPLAVLAGAAATAAVLPAGEAGWFPLGYFVDGQPVGAIWVGYHMLLGSTLFTAVMLAGETVTSPLTRRGQIVYGLGIGALTVGLRWWPVALLSGCWAVMVMNTVAGAIDWVDRRWRLRRGG